MSSAGTWVLAHSEHQLLLQLIVLVFISAGLWLLLSAERLSGLNNWGYCQ